MENLKELVKLVSKHKIKKVEVMGNASNYNSKMRSLYDGIISGEMDTDAAAMKILYDSEDSFESFRKLKNRLKNRLLNTIFFIDVDKPNFNDFQKAYYSCRRQLAAVDIIMGRGARKVAIELAEKTLKTSIEFEFTDVSLSLLKKLTRHYGLMETNSKKFLRYYQLTEEHLEIYNAETLAEQFHVKLRVAKRNLSFSNIPEVIEEVRKCNNKLEEFLGKVRSSNFITFAYHIMLTECELKKDYAGALKICNQALEELGKKKSKYTSGTFSFISRKVECLIKLQRQVDAEKAILNSLEIIPEGKINWYISYEKYMRLLFHKKEYQKAFDIFMKVSKEYGFQPVYKNIRELWKIYEAYYHFFIAIGKIDPSKTEHQTKKKFKLGKFLNEVPTYSTDRRGYNIPILIIQFLFLLQQKKYGIVIDKVEALNAYCYRHLKKDDTFRSNCFIKMLLLLPKCDFHKTAVERKSKLLLNKLKSVPLEEARQSAEVEIVPYEDLWEIVLDMLDHKFHRIKAR
ncbi:MAG: hypothetical protein AAF573_17025 [Bacteroidota bacterium]